MLIEGASASVHDIIESYAHVYQLPNDSYIYLLVLWLTFAVVFVIVSALHWVGGRATYMGSLLNKWLLRRRTWRKKHSLAKAIKAGKKHSQPYSLPSNSQLTCITLLWILVILLSFVGPDYIVPHTKPPPRPLILGRDIASSAVGGNVFQSTIQKSWWTSSARLGILAIGLFPLCILLVIRAPPFAIAAVPYFVQIWSDKLVFMHKWTGRLIYFITVLHVIFWSVQLAKDTVSLTNHHSVWTVIFKHIPFVYAWLAFIFFTILIILSFKPIRHKRFEFFYATHVLLVPLVLIFAALHFPRLQGWSWFTLALWGSERIFRFAKLLWVNAMIGNLRTAPMTLRYIDFVNNEHAGLTVPNTKDETQEKMSHGVDTRRPGYSLRGTYVPPPGYAHIALLPGKTVRVRIVVPRYFYWAPGQYVLLTIPAISRFQSHPFTVSSACSDGLARVDTQDIVLVIRAQGGFTKSLYEHVEKLQNENSRGDTPEFSHIAPHQGVLLRAYVGGAFGSSIRVNWTTYSSIVIVAGGSGCSYAASILEHLTSCVAGEKDMTLSGKETAGQIKRIRFVWIVREFAYLQWIASIVCRAMERVPEGTLQVDIYVTNAMSKKAGKRFTLPSHTLDTLHPAVASYLGYGADDDVSLVTPDQDFEGQLQDDILVESELGHEEHVLDMTNFGGEDDTMFLPERELSRQLQAEGEIRRAETEYRRAATFLPEPAPLSQDALSEYHQSLRESRNEAHETFEATDQDSIQTLRSSVAPSPASRRPPVPISNFVSDLREADDMFVLSEMAHSGRARMDKIIAEEVAHCSGTSMLVCCCAPTALIASIRKNVAENIKPACVSDGRAPAITLVSEEFDN